MPPATPRRDEPASPARAEFAARRRAGRLRRWTLIALVSGALGLVGARLLGSWPAGLLVLAVTATGLLIWDHHTGAVTGWRPQDHGESAFAAAAARLEKRGWRVIRLPGLLTRVFIGPGGVFVAEPQEWPGSDPVRISPMTGLLQVGDLPAARRVRDVRAAAAVVGEAVSDLLPDDVAVRPVVAVRGSTLTEPRSTIGVIIVPLSDLVRHLRRTDVVLGAAQIEALTKQVRQRVARVD
jgi:hypothetical protein